MITPTDIGGPVQTNTDIGNPVQVNQGSGSQFYTVEEMAIFSYSIPGEQLGGPTITKHADPLKIRRDLMRKSGGQIDNWVDDWMSAPPSSQENGGEQPSPGIVMATIQKNLQAEEKIIPVVREVFGLTPIDEATGIGVPEAIVLSVYTQFTNWLDQKKTMPGVTPAPSQSSAGLLGLVDQAMSSGLGSSSTKKNCGCAGLTT